MTLKSIIGDGRGTGNLTGISNAGEVIISGIGEGLSSYVNMVTLNTPYNFYAPKSGYEFFITTIISSGAATTVLSIYETDVPTSSTINRLLVKFDFRITKLIIIPFSFGGYIRVNEGSFINAIATQSNVITTIMGFYKPI